MWTPISCGEPSDEAFVARCLLGAGWVGANRRLGMVDLRVWAALCAQLRTQVLLAPAEADLDLGHPDARTVETTGYQVADMVWGHDSGEHYRLLRASLARLASVRATVQIVEADPELAAEIVRTGYVPLLGEMWFATTRLNLQSPREWGALHGSTSLRVEIGRWAAVQITEGHCAWLDLDLLRKLGGGLAARVWATLEAWGRWPQRSLDGREETAIGLGRPALESFGVAHYARRHDARRALNRAGAQLVKLDRAYELVRCEKRAGWCLVVRRLSGGKARAQARSGATRSQGIAANKRQQSERAAVRAQARASLARDAS